MMTRATAISFKRLACPQRIRPARAAFRLAFTASILSLTSHDLRLRQTLAFGNHEVREVTLTAIDKEFVCPDMPK